MDEFMVGTGQRRMGMKSSKKQYGIFLLIVALGGCGGPQFQVGETWDPKEAQFFDDGIDVIKDFSNLSGDWAFRRENELDGRV